VDAQTIDTAVADYNVGWVEKDEWLNYTRTFARGQYFVYARLASGNGPPFEASLSKVTGANTSNQTATVLGSFKGDIGHGWQFYSFILLTDPQTNRVIVNLNGPETLRVTAITTNAYNANFYMVIPAPILEIALQQGKAVISWQTNLTGFVLQSTPSLSAPNWGNITDPIAIVNGRNTVTNDISGTSKFYRLRE